MPFPALSYMLILNIACHRTGKVPRDFSILSVYKPDEKRLVCLPLHSSRKKL